MCQGSFSKRPLSLVIAGRFLVFVVSLCFFSSVEVYGQAFLDWLPEGGEAPIHHTYYSFSYSEAHEQACWVAYKVDYRKVFGPYERSEDFREDPKVMSGSASLEDYVGSGYDRGHLAPAGDMAFSDTAMSESFYMSDMSPQHPSFNRGKWKSLETQFRSWAFTDSMLYVVTGPVLEDSLPKIGENGVTIPSYYYKIAVCPSSSGIKSIAFLLPNKKLKSKLATFIVSIDSVESVTGLDFFAGLDDSLEEELEARVNADSWTFGLVEMAKTGAVESVKKNQCKGITKKNKRCKKTASGGSDFCWMHEDQAPKQCSAITNAGKQCSRMTSNTSGKCWQHE